MKNVWYFQFFLYSDTFLWYNTWMVDFVIQKLPSILYLCAQSGAMNQSKGGHYELWQETYQEARTGIGF